MRSATDIRYRQSRMSCKRVCLWSMMHFVRCRWGLVALAAVACGDNIPLSRAHNLVIVAHQDDDLLFMQPDLSGAIHRGSPTTIVYVTAGDGGAGLDYAA